MSMVMMLKQLHWLLSLLLSIARLLLKMSLLILFCFRKLGHNEQDEPMVTQPLMYKLVSKHPGTRKVYGDKLIAEGVLAADGPDLMIQKYRDHLDKGGCYTTQFWQVTSIQI